MPEQVQSAIREISSLGADEIKKRDERPFEFWGPTPHEARKAAVAKKKGLRDKRTTMKKAISKHVKDGMNLGIGGFVNTRVPLAAIHEIIRHGVKDLTLSFQSISMCSELLLGAMIINPDHVSVKRVELAWWGYEIIGIAPLFRHFVSSGALEVDDYTNFGMSVRFKAGAMGLPFIPIKDHGGSDMEIVNRGTMLKCPFTGENTYVVPSCNPDLGLVHVNACDAYGNARIFGALCTCPEIAQASCHTILTTERIIETNAIRQHPNLTEIPFPVVDEVVEQPFGSYPGACYGNYWFDMPEFLEFRKAGDDFRKTGNKDKLKEYYDKYIFGCETFDDYLATRPYSKIKELRQQDQGQSTILI